MKLKFAVALFVMLSSAFAGDWKEGKHYKIINPAGKSATPVVTEIFSYGCPVCYSTEPKIAEWLKTKPATIRFQRLPHYGIHDENGLFIRMFYVAEELGILDKTHGALFDVVHMKHKHHFTNDEAQSFLASFTKDEKKVRDNFNSFVIENKIRNAENYVQQYRLQKVPAFVINEKYYTDSSMAGNDLFTVINDLANKK